MHEPRRRPACRLGAAVLLAVSLVACGGAGSTIAPISSVSGDRTPAPSPTIAATPVPSDGQTAGQARLDSFGVDQVWVPAGSFTMGTDAVTIAKLTKAGPPPWVASEFPSEVPAHEVRITRGYWIDTYEVTNAEFGDFVGSGGYTTEDFWSEAGRAWLTAQGDKRLPLHCQGDVAGQPRMCITWYEAEAYAAWRTGRLPTEAEWEYAARGPESRVYPWGDAFDADRANVINSVAPQPVGSFPTGASWVGAQDMAGNAMEWVFDWLGVDYYAMSPTDGPTGPASGEVKVEKGGWWGSNEFVARSAYRHYEDPPTYSDKHIGFRVASQ